MYVCLQLLIVTYLTITRWEYQVQSIALRLRTGLGRFRVFNKIRKHEVVRLVEQTK